MSKPRLIFSELLVDRKGRPVDEEFGFNPDDPFAAEADRTVEEVAALEAKKQQVREIVDGLPFEERELIKLLWFEGKKLGEIAEATGRKESKLVLIRKRAMIHLQRLMTGLGLGEGKTCPLCELGDESEFDVWVKSWLDEHRWRTYGLITAIDQKFSMRVQTAAVIEHVKAHMGGVDEKKLASLGRRPRPKIVDGGLPDAPVPMMLNVSGRIKADLQIMAAEYDTTIMAMARRAIEYGMPVLRSLLQLKEFYADAAVELAKELKPIKGLDEVK